MYGLIGKFTAAPNKREDLLAILLQNHDMPGCKSYVVARDPSDENGIWITEVWDTKDSHAASLQIESVREAIKKAMPMITNFGPSFETDPVGGVGI